MASGDALLLYGLRLQFVIAYFLFPMGLQAYLTLALLLAGAFGISLLLHEFVHRRLKWIRLLFGMKLAQR